MNTGEAAPPTEDQPDRAADEDLSALASELRVVLGRMIRRLRIEYRFSLTQAAVLGRLDREGPQSIGQLATAERVRPQSMSQTLGELEGDGLVTRGPDEHDGRRARIELTAAGRKALELDRARREGWLAKEIARLSAGEQAVLREAVEVLCRLSER